MVQSTSAPNARDRLLFAALKLVREEGYDSTSVDDLCREAGVTKGAFFHHFASKEQLAVEGTKFWTKVTGAAFLGAAYHAHADPFDQLIGYVEFRRELLKGRSLAEFSCFLGTMVQEKYAASPAIRDACLEGIMSHASTVEEIIAAAKAHHCPEASWSPQSLALHTQTVIQGAFILAKATNDATTADDMIAHLKRYIELLFNKNRED